MLERFNPRFTMTEFDFLSVAPHWPTLKELVACGIVIWIRNYSSRCASTPTDKRINDQVSYFFSYKGDLMQTIAAYFDVPGFSFGGYANAYLLLERCGDPIMNAGATHWPRLNAIKALAAEGLEVMKKVDSTSFMV